MDSQINRFFNNFYRLFKIYLFFLAVFTLFRFWFFVRLGDFKELIKLPGDILIAFLRGMQFDTMIICYFLLIPFLIYSIGVFIKNEEYFRKSAIFIAWYSGITLAIACIILFVDQYYYNYFQTHISVIIFGLADDDSQTVMSSVWTDYPIIRIALAWIGILLGFKYYLKRVYAQQVYTFSYPKRLKALTVILILGLYSFGLRGSMGSMPLQIQNSTVSDNNFINFLTINGIYALKNSYEERQKSANVIESELSNLQALGYQNPTEAARDYFETTTIGDNSDSIAFEMLFQKTPKNTLLEKDKPNVVFVFMESMSNYNINLDSEQMNLLGSLRNHFQSDYLFRNFVSSGNITIQSLEYLMVGSPIGLSQTKYRFNQLPSSVALPFSRSGYQTNFITGGKVNWRAMDKFALNQGFDTVKGMLHIKANLPGCKANKWGVYDEYLFDYVYKRLTEKKDKTPKFFFIQTTTNHTPFELPSDYKPFKIALSDSLKERLLVTEQLAIKNLNAYQYANNSLGNFLDKIKNSELGKNTIVVMTGDHNNLMLFDFDEAHQLQQRGVPLYMYVPEKYRSKDSINTSVFASHKDIFPTIFNLSLSNAKYFSLGNNLLEAKEDNPERYFGMNIGSFTSFSSNAAVNYSTSKAFYTWQDPNDKVLKKVSKSAEAEALLKRSRANYALSMFYILNQISK